MTRFLSVVLCLLLGATQTATSQTPVANAPAILEIRIVEGEGAVYPIGSRATRGITVLVTDETGRPVPGATVSFTLPAGGSSGLFGSGAGTEIVTTQADGHAAIWGMQWNRIPGPFEIRITAVKGQARAGTICSGYLSDAPAAPGRARTAMSSSKEPGGGHKWLWIGLAVGGAAAAGVVGLAARSSNNAAAASASTLTIGAPTITLGR